MWLLVTIVLALSVGAWTTVGIIGAASVTGGITWLVASRKESGSVERSDAGTVFDAYDRAFERVEREVLRLDEANGRLRERLAAVEHENAELRLYKDRVAVLEAEVERLRRIVNGH